MLVKKAQGQCPNKFLSGKKNDMSSTIKSPNLKKAHRGTKFSTEMTQIRGEAITVPLRMILKNHWERKTSKSLENSKYSSCT